MTIKYDCKSCCKTTSFELELPDLCMDCFVKKIGLTPSKNRWRSIKKFTYGYLIIGPSSFFICREFDLQSELFFCGGIMLGLIFENIIDFLMKKF